MNHDAAVAGVVFTAPTESAVALHRLEAHAQLRQHQRLEKRMSLQTLLSLLALESDSSDRTIIAWSSKYPRLLNVCNNSMALMNKSSVKSLQRYAKIPVLISSNCEYLELLGDVGYSTAPRVDRKPLALGVVITSYRVRVLKTSSWNLVQGAVSPSKYNVYLHIYVRMKCKDITDQERLGEYVSAA